MFIFLFSGRFWQPGTPESGRPARFAGRGRDYGELGHNVQSVYFVAFQGDFGSQGLQSLDGLPGLPGEDGTTGN